jgi:ABC-type branched-subunit amino acid transport system permease subunit
MDIASLAQIMFAGLSNGALYAFLGLGFGLVIRGTGLINFAQGDMMMLGGILTAVLTRAGLPVAIAAVLAVAFCTILSAAFYWVAIRPAHQATMAQVVLITIGFSIVIRGTVTTIWGSDPMSVEPFTGGAPLNVFGVSVLPQELWLIGTLVAVTILTGLFFRFTVLGLALRAGAVNPLGASFVGIDNRTLGLLAFAASGLLGGLAGAVWSPISYAQVDVGLSVALKGFTAAILGGLLSNYGPILGGVLLALVESVTAGYISSAYMDTISFGLLLVALILRPQGLLGGTWSMTSEERPEEVLSKPGSSTGISQRDVYMFVFIAALLGAVGFVVSGTWLTSGIFTGIMTLVVMGLVLLTGYGGQLSLGQGSFMMIGAYSTGYLTVSAGWPPVVAMAFGAALAVLLAFVLGRIIFVLRGLYLSMASFGLLMITLSIAREWQSVTGGPSGQIGIVPFSIGPMTFVTDRDYYFLILGISLAALLFCLSIARSRIGRALLAIRSSESAARACGVDVVSHKLRVFAISAACASIAGSLYAHYLNFANPAPFGIDATISQLTALTVGGFLSLWGSYFGAGVVVILPIAIIKIVGSTSSQLIAGLQYLTFGLLLILIVLAQTNGLFERVNALFKRGSSPFGRDSGDSAAAPAVPEEKQP